MIYKITSTAFDTTGDTPIQKITSAGEYYRTEEIDTETNEIFENCETAWQVEDTFEMWWNRLNPSTEYDGQRFFSHDPTSKVKVVKIEVIK